MAEAAGSPLIRVSGLTVRYGAVTALDHVDLAITPGMFLAVLGPNGSGKTTLFRCLLGLAEYEGRVESRARRIGYVPQIKNFDRSFPGRSVEVVISGIVGAWPGPLALRRHRERACAALAEVGADAFADRPLHALSGGQLQRVYLARALVHGPDLLMLDEPAAGVDRAGEADLYECLEGYQARNPELAVAMITHDWEVARHHADTSLLLDHSVLAFGPSAEVLTEDTLRRAFGHVGHHHDLGVTS
ncbi:zinc transport system ATP-binding protein [Thiohalospira halophila DSM 15071]|uniref:Zinc transport system ATP-binding protein n=1 Tax=Thiohalospira halophila DSM 15071 TaxID=1123397 RepID=A0A1I1VZW7_9GAMM|nr:metal ABC transporter ATP-binding protein [Thiohalospira halophila]SFD88365.1 zinc transport system ATP-binding protein [Thiohalospira halophila DSM 15071]